MARGDKLLWSMKADPRAEWTIADVEAVARANGVAFQPSEEGSHHALSHPLRRGHLTIPASRRIKPLYICLLIDMIEGSAKS